MNQSKIIMVVVGVVILGALGFAVYSSSQSEEASTQSTMTDVTTTTTNETMDTMNTQNIVEVAQGAGTFSTLLAAATAAGLVETLSGEGPYTVFAPTDEAFNKLPAGTVESLLADKEKLKQILTYHVVAGKVMAKDVVTLSTATTVEGSDVNITSADGKVMINDATVTATDIEASNGVIHVIDTVLMP